MTTVPLWAKVLIGVTAAIVVTGAIVGPAVYFGLAGQYIRDAITNLFSRKLLIPQHGLIK